MTDEAGTPAAAPERWAIVEMMGHLTRAGRISRVEDFGATLMRIEIPVGDGFVTEDVGGASLYRVRYVTEEVARAAAARMADPRPVAPAGFQARAALPHRADHDGDDDGEF